jgi:aldehyde:ferredoxin oxidoreductase
MEDRFMVKGVMGKVLFVNLSQRTNRVEPVPEEVYQKYLSGLGLGVRLLYDRIPPSADPLGPENILGLLSGVLVGTGAMFAGRFLVVGKSPLTGGWGDSNCGGNLAPAIKQCGYDGVFFEGCSAQPVYALITDQKVEILPADDLWGKDTTETEDRLIQRHGGRSRVACIGPAGENQVRFAGIANQHGRIAGRSGLGAVMGAKRLKAIVLTGTKKAESAHPDEIHRLSKEVVAYMPKGGLSIPSWALPLAGWFMMKSKTAFRTDGLTSLGPMQKWGTASGNEVCFINGDAPVRNWRGVPRLFRSKIVSADALVRNQKKNYHCTACPLGCGGICELRDKYGATSETHRPEYETTTAFGSLLLNKDLETIIQINESLNRFGIDSISAGAVIAFAIDCVENGVLTEQDTNGLHLRWGNERAITRLVEMIVHREGIGDLLADGVRLAAERIGKNSEQFAFHAHGQELPMHDPRYNPLYGVLYVADPTPGRHTIGSDVQYEMFRLWTRVSWAPEVQQTYSKSSLFEVSPENGVKAAACSILKGLVDSAGLCLFGIQLGVDRLRLFELLNAATGLDQSPDEYMEIGRRIQNLRQGFNLRQGLEPSSVTVNPLVYGEPPANAGPHKGKQFDLYTLRQEYWKAMKWDAENGHPMEELVGHQ